MKEKFSLLLLFFAAILFLSAPALAKCKDSRDVPVEAISQLGDWDELYASYLKYGECGIDGYVAEDYSGKIEQLFSNNWSQISKLAALAKRDRGFEIFVIYHINELWSPDSVAALSKNLKGNCRLDVKELCDKLLTRLEKGDVFPALGPQIEDWSIFPPTQKRPPVNKISLGNFNVELEKITLADLKKTIGAGVVQHRGDAGESTHWLCYAIPAENDVQHIWFISGELSEYIVEIHAKSGEKSLKSCPQLPDKFKPLTVNNTLWLGSRAEELRTAFGDPSGEVGNWAVYFYEGKTLLKTKDTPFDVQAALSVAIVHRKVVGISIMKTTTD